MPKKITSWQVQVLPGQCPLLLTVVYQNFRKKKGVTPNNHPHAHNWTSLAAFFARVYSTETRTEWRCSGAAELVSYFRLKKKPRLFTNTDVDEWSKLSSHVASAEHITEGPIWTLDRS